MATSVILQKTCRLRGKRVSNSNSWEEAGDKSDRLDKSQVQGEMGLFGESCRSRPRVGQWSLPVR